MGVAAVGPAMMAVPKTGEWVGPFTGWDPVSPLPGQGPDNTGH